MASDKLDALFERYMGDSPIFRDREVLRHDYIPTSFPHREAEILRLGSILAPSLKGVKCSNIFIYGKTGTGKTAVTRYILNRLSEAGGKMNGGVRSCYVNCRFSGTEYRVISQLCASLGVRVPFTGLATAEVFNRFKKGVEARKSTFIAVLDEVDNLVEKYGDGILYEMTRINEDLDQSQVAIVGISNNLYFKDTLDPRVLSTLGEEEMVFKPYTAHQIREIIEMRLDKAFRPGVFPEAALNLCSALAAAEHGDARRALDLVRVAGEIAERRTSTVITEAHIREAQRKIEQDRVYEVLGSLPLHSKIILCAVHNASKKGGRSLTTGGLLDIYKRLCQGFQLEPLTHRRVSGLLSELDMLGIINTSITNLGRYGRTKKIDLNVPPEVLAQAFSDDPRIEDILAKDSHPQEGAKPNIEEPPYSLTG